jgi:hypothetical protein
MMERMSGAAWWAHEGCAPEGELPWSTPLISGGLERYRSWGVSAAGVAPLHPGAAADQATSTEAIPIINSAVHHIDQAPATASLGQGSRSSSNRVVQLVE